ncbi:aminoglycoside 3'-phosphotransferase [Leucobacter zeae]|nr:aminoglycoside 3'-phosphotransferase [Leucobacter zeae]
MVSKPLAAIPDGPVDVPAAVAELAGDRPLRPVWRNALGGVTFELNGGIDGGTDGAEPSRFVKWVAAGTLESDLVAEEVRLAWAAEHGARVPRVLSAGADPHGSWLVTEAIPAASAVSDRWIRDPATAARAIGAGLRELHETLPASGCPFEWSVGARLARVRARTERGEGPADWSREHRGLGRERALAILADPPPVDRSVVCHGDACAPNTLIAADGAFAGHVDLGDLGVADRWADLAVAAWSTEWNYGASYADELFAGYGVEPDRRRIAYYRLLWDLS